MAKTYTKESLRKLLKEMCDFCEDREIKTAVELKKEIDWMLSIHENNYEKI